MTPGEYPQDLESDVILADGRVAHVRPIVPSDVAGLRDLGSKLSAESIYLRFFSPRRQISDAEFRHFANVDYDRRLAIIALVDGDLVAVARYDREANAKTAEVAFTVRDDQQGRGLGMLLLEHLASAARDRGITRFEADTLAINEAMLRVFRRAGFEEKTAFGAGVIHVTLDLEPASGYREHLEERDRRAAVRSIERLLRPRSIAVVGASDLIGSLGHEVVANLIAGQFTGLVYPVVPSDGARGGPVEICGLPTVADVGEIDGPVDLAVIAVPVSEVLSVTEACGRKGVSGLVVVTGGFAEAGAEGAEAERQLVSLARSYGMRVVGPNCLGVVNTAPEISMNATFSPARPIPGPIGFSSQSGGLGIAILEEATRRDLGVSSFVAVGNKVDVSGNDLIRYWDADPRTEVILLYLESFGNPRHFARIAKEVGRRKPIVAVKSGRSGSGSRGTSSHTAALASPDATVNALFRQAGVIRVDTLEELFDVADVLSHQPLPTGRNVAIIGNAGGPGVLAADACEGAGLAVPELCADTQRRLRAVLSKEAAVSNPVDCVAIATAEQYRRALEIVLAADEVDAVIAVFTPPLVTHADDVAAQVAAVAASATKPILAVFLATANALSELREGKRRVPWFAYPESAARALGRIVPYASWRVRADVPVPVFDDLDRDRGRAIVEAALAEASGEAPGGVPEGGNDGPAAPEAPADARVRPGASRWLDQGQTSALLEAHGIPFLGTAGGGGPEEAAQAALQAEPGVETIVGVVEEAGFGPVVMVGLAGPATEVLGDTALSLVPITRPEAMDLISSLKAARMLSGYRGAPAADLGELADLLCRVAQLAEHLPEVVEMTLNPVIASPKGCLVVDAKVRVARPVTPEPELWRRHLR